MKFKATIFFSLYVAFLFCIAQIAYHFKKGWIFIVIAFASAIALIIFLIVDGDRIMRTKKENKEQIKKADPIQEEIKLEPQQEERLFTGEIEEVQLPKIEPVKIEEKKELSETEIIERLRELKAERDKLTEQYFKLRGL